MRNRPFCEEYEDCFLTCHLKIWGLVFNRALNWFRLVESLSVIVGANLTACKALSHTPDEPRSIVNSKTPAMVTLQERLAARASK